MSTKPRLSGLFLIGSKQRFVCSDWVDFLTSYIAQWKSLEKWSVLSDKTVWIDMRKCRHFDVINTDRSYLTLKK